MHTYTATALYAELAIATIKQDKGELESGWLYFNVQMGLSVS